MEKEKELTIINEFKSGALLKDIVNKYQITVYEGRMIRKNNNLEKYQPFNDDILNEKVIDLYKKNIDYEQIKKELNISTSTIGRILKKHNIYDPNYRKKPKKYKNINNTIFNKINTELSAYYLGLLISDGNVHKKANAISFCCAKSDSYILEPLSNAIYGFNNVKYYKRKNEKHEDKSILNINSYEMKDILNRMDITPCKSFTATIPINFIEESVIFHFIRGMWDGDGTWGLTKGNKTRSCSFIGSVMCCESLKNLLLKHNIKSRLTLLNDCSQPLAKIDLYSMNEMIKLGDLLYKDATIYLKRKFNIYKAIKEYFNNKIPKKCKYKHITKTKSNTFLARISHMPNKRLELGSFKTENEAAEAFNKKALELFGSNAELIKIEY